MTQEEKAKRFDEALAMAKECITYVPDNAVNQYMLDMFPELKESVDERIRKEFCEDIWTYIPYEKAHKYIAWIEKQGQTFIKKDVDDAYLKGVCDAKSELEKQGEQNHCMIQWKGDNLKEVIDFTGKDKNFEKWFKSFEEYEKYVQEHDGIFKLFNADGSHYEVPVGAWIVKTPDGYNVASKAIFRQKSVDTPKFKVGDWVVVNNKHQSIYQVEKIEDGYYILRHTHGGTFRVCVLHDESLRLWSIEDAKDGDVLADKYNNIGIFQECEGICWHSYIYLGCDGELRGFSIGGSHEQTDTHPATKEQRDTLMKATADAGFTFDFNKKELKKIEQKSATMSLDEAIEHCKEKSCGNNACALEHKQLEKWLTELKELKEPNPAWSEDDEWMLSEAINAVIVSDYAEGRKERCIDWLKSLKDRYTWKPSERPTENDLYYNIVKSLREQLKKLKGE